MIKKIVVFLFIMTTFAIKADEIDSTWFSNNYTKKEVYIPMRDGIKLFTSIYIPKSNLEKHPILMTRTPYTCMPYGEDKFRSFYNSYMKEYLKEGYIMVTQDVRGRWMSEGEYIDIRPYNPKKKGKDIDEASDTYDTIDWLIKNIKGNNGRVGVFGISYPGFYSTMAAACNHPALKAVSPQAPVTNWFLGDDVHHNGAFFLMDNFGFYAAQGFGFGIPHPHPTKEFPSMKNNNNDNYKFYLESGCINNLTKLTGDSIKFWNEIMDHPNYDEYWKSRDARNATKNLKPAMLWVGGLFDAEDCWGTWNSYKAAEENNPGKEFNKIIEGPWYHGGWARGYGNSFGKIQFGQNTSEYYQQKFEIPFFNYFLKDKGDISQIAEATIFITGENKWEEFKQWPPKNITETSLYLKQDGKLSFDSTSDEGFTEYTSDPSKPVPYEEFVHHNRTAEYMINDQRFAARRTDVVVFQTDTLTQDITVTGPVVADILTSISTTDADFIVKVIDVFPDDFSYNEEGNDSSYKKYINNYPMGGFQMLVRGDVFRGRYRKSFEEPEAFVPNKIEEVKYEMTSIAHCFKKGHRIMVQIQSSWFPLVDRNPQQFVDIYHCKESDFVKSDIKIYHDAHNASRIILPILKQ